MIRCKTGDVILVRFPFTDLSSSKKRPAVVLSTPRFTAQHGDVVVLAISGQPQKGPAIQLTEWQATGLLKPSWLKPVVGTLDSSLVLRRLGQLQGADLPRVKEVLQAVIAPKFLPAR